MPQAEREPETTATYEPPAPTWVTTAVLTLWIAILSLPMWSGKFLAGQFSDQYHSGFAFRHWLASEWKRTGKIPLWNPELFGGMPFVGAMHGDIFYPTSWLRLILPTGTAMNLGFAIHYVLAGLFLYLLLRLLRVSWTGAVVGGLAYQLSGVIGSYVQPGHDGKLFVTALLPLALIGLVLGIRDRRYEGYGILALSVGLALVSPQAQMTYYMLVVAGLFALYLALGEADGRSWAERLVPLGLAFAAVAVGFGIGMIQILPFYHYLPFSPRAEGYYGFEGSTSYALPWSHVPELALANFVGTSFDGTYWGGNPMKLHSEYLGLPVVALGALGLFDSRRRLVYWLSGIGLLFFLISLGAATPFYRLWWTVMPFVKQTRAPGMALYVVALVLAVFAGLGAARLERAQGRTERWVVSWMIAGGIVAVLALLGVFGAVAESLAQGGGSGQGTVALRAAVAGRSAIRMGALLSGLALALLGGVVWALARGKVPARALVLALPLLVSADLWRNARGFWTYTDSPESGLYGPDAVTNLLREVERPFRVLDLSDTGIEAYRGSSLMAFGIPQLLGHHGNQLHAFNELMGGKNQWQILSGYLFASRRLWDLFAVRYVLLSADLDLSGRVAAFTGFADAYDTVMAGVLTSNGGRATVFERRDPVRYARLVPAALKVPDEQAIPAIADRRSQLDFDRVVLLDTAAAIDLAPLDTLPEPLAVRVIFETWEPGHMVMRLEPSAPQEGYLVVAENYYYDWKATVDGVAAEVLRGNVSLITVPVPAGAAEVSLSFESADYRLGRMLTLGSLLLAVGGIVGPIAARRLRG